MCLTSHIFCNIKCIVKVIFQNVCHVNEEPKGIRSFPFLIEGGTKALFFPPPCIFIYLKTKINSVIARNIYVQHLWWREISATSSLSSFQLKPNVWCFLSQQMLTDRTPMIHLGDDDLNPLQQISYSTATAMKSRWLWHGDKKRLANVLLDCSSRGFEGMGWRAWQISKYWKVFHTSRSSFFLG